MSYLEEEFPDAMAEINRVALFGKKKHKDNDWRKRANLKDELHHAKNHWERHRVGVFMDRETGYWSLAHLAARIIIALQLLMEKQNAS
jgi:hypothetical protein